MAFERSHVMVEFMLRDKAAGDELVANIVDEIAQDWTSVMSRRKYVNNRIDASRNRQCVRWPMNRSIPFLAE